MLFYSQHCTQALGFQVNIAAQAWVPFAALSAKVNRWRVNLKGPSVMCVKSHPIQHTVIPMCRSTYYTAVRLHRYLLHHFLLQCVGLCLTSARPFPASLVAL